MAQNSKTRAANGPMDRLKSEAVGLLDALGDRAVSSLRNKVEGAAGRLTDYVEGDAGPGLMAAVTGAKGLAEGKSPARSVLGAGMTFAKEKVPNLFAKAKRKKNLNRTTTINPSDVVCPIHL